MPKTWPADAVGAPPLFATPRNPLRKTRGPAISLVAEAKGHQHMPWQRQVVDVANEIDPETGDLWYDTVIVLVPRQSGKTTLVGDQADHRCLTQPKARVWFTMQDGQHAQDWMIKEHHSVLRESKVLGPLAHCTQQAGAARVTWSNSSVFQVFPPKANALHSKQVDIVFWDEAWDRTREDGTELEQAAEPGMATRDSAQTWVLSTQGTEESTWLQDWYDIGEASLSEPGTRIAFFHWGIPEDGDPEDLDLVMAHHPAVGFTMTRAKLEAAFDKYKKKNTLDQWARAYGNRPTRGKRITAFPKELWDKCGAPQPDMPDHFGLAFDVQPGGQRSAVMASWRDEDGNAWVEVMEERAGYEWVAPFVAEIARKYKVPVGYDTKGNYTLTVADQLGRKHRSVRQRGMTTTEYVTSCATFAAEVRNGNLRHTRQKVLDEAVDCAATRPMLDDGWLWTRKTSTGNIAPVVAATVALRMYDDNPKKRSLKILVSA